MSAESRRGASGAWDVGRVKVVARVKQGDSGYQIKPSGLVN